MIIRIIFDKIQLMNRIGEVLKEKKLSQAWLSAQLNKSYNMVNSYVQQRRQPKLQVLFQIAQILEVDVRDLLDSQHNVEKEIKRNATNC